MLACSVAGISNIDVFDMNSKKKKKITIAHSKMGKDEHIYVKISDDCTTAIFSNGIEHYIHDGSSQSNFPWIKDKFLRAA